MDRKTAMFCLAILALLILPGMVEIDMNESTLRTAAAYGMAAYVVALTYAIFGALSKIINGICRERKQ